MSYLSDAFTALYSAGLPVAIFSFLMMFWALKRGYLSEELLDQDKHAPEKDAPPANIVHKKWFMFGGGFYGLIALLTYAVIEGQEIYGFVMQYPSLAAMLDQVSIGAIIKLLVDSLMNLIAAATWFLYWPKQFAMAHPLVWLAVAYASYRTGVYAARWYYSGYHNPRTNTI